MLADGKPKKMGRKLDSFTEAVTRTARAMGFKAVVEVSDGEVRVYAHRKNINKLQNRLRDAIVNASAQGIQPGFFRASLEELRRKS